MTSTWWYRVPLIASWQRDKVTTRGGRPRTHRPAGDAEAKRAHALHALAARPRGWDVGGAVEVQVYYCRVTGHARDTDRVTSLVCDAIKGVVCGDDNDTRIIASGSRRLWTSPGPVPGIDVPPLMDGETLVIVRRSTAPAPPKRKPRSKPIAVAG